jgi:hypothetical protein
MTLTGKGVEWNNQGVLFTRHGFDRTQAIKIVGEETCYNARDEPFRLLILDSALDGSISADKIVRYCSRLVCDARTMGQACK